MTIQATIDRLEHLVKSARKRGASAARITFSRSLGDECDFENGRLKNVVSGEKISYKIKTVVNGKTGSASGNIPEGMEEMLSRALNLAKNGSTAHFREYPPPGPITSVKMYSEKTARLTLDKMASDCAGMIETIRQYDPDLFICAAAGKATSDCILVTSGGVRHTETATAWSLGAYTQRTDGSDMLFTGFGRNWRDLPSFYDPAFIARQNIDDLDNARQTGNITSGKCPVLLSPKITAMFLSGIFSGVNGRNVAKGDSPLGDKLGKQVLHESFTITDDPHRDFCPGAAAVDNDGIPANRRIIFDKGKLKMFLYDLDTAGLADAQPTGNDGCSPYSPDVRPGKRTKDELMSSVNEGIYVKQLIGYGQSNMMNGDFSANVGLGYRIHKGELSGRIKNVMISGNLYDLLGGDIEISSERDEMTRMPYLLAGRIDVNAGR